MRTIDVLPLSISVLIIACRPITLRVETPAVESAQLRTHVVKGDKPAVPSQCATPCEIAVRHGSEHVLNIEAPGYYPAQFNITYDNLRVAPEVDDDDSRLLRVPLRRRPTIPVPSSQAPVPGE